MLTEGLTQTSGATPLDPAQASAVMAQLAAINYVQQAPAMLVTALNSNDPESDIHVEVLLSAFPDLRDKLLQRSDYTPLQYVIRQKRWAKAKRLIDLGASTTGVFWSLYEREISMNIPELAEELEKMFQEALATSPDDLSVRKLSYRQRPDWAWQLILRRIEREREGEAAFAEDEDAVAFVLNNAEHLATLLARPETRWPCLVGFNDRCPIANWQMIAKARPELLAVPEHDDGKTMLHVASAEWIQHVAPLLPEKLLWQMLHAKISNDMEETPWLYQIQENNLDAPRALYALVLQKELPIDLRAQRTKKGDTAVHMAFRRSANKFILWLVDDLGMNLREKNTQGEEPWMRNR